MNINNTFSNPNLTPFSSDFHAISHHSPHVWQTYVGNEFIFLFHRLSSTEPPLRYLCVRPTGGGKTLLFTTIAKVFGGITICITPLISLGAAHTSKVLQMEHDQSITSFHLDELSQAQLVTLKDLLHSSRTRGKTTTILFTSPQAILRHYQQFISPFLSLIRFIVIDEVHLHVHFGRGFRSEFARLQSSFFANLETNVPHMYLTGTCTPRIADAIPRFFGSQLSHYHWPSPREMAVKKVSIKVKYTDRPLSSTIDSTIST
jgi:superfamily II DNA helicase RecQ